MLLLEGREELWADLVSGQVNPLLRLEQGAVVLSRFFCAERKTSLYCRSFRRMWNAAYLREGKQQAGEALEVSQQGRHAREQGYV